VHLPHHLVDNAGDERLAEMAEFLSCRAHHCADVLSMLAAKSGWSYPGRVAANSIW
jgi:hypothetical protein